MCRVTFKNDQHQLTHTVKTHVCVCVCASDAVRRLLNFYFTFITISGRLNPHNRTSLVYVSFQIWININIKKRRDAQTAVRWDYFFSGRPPRAKVVCV